MADRKRKQTDTALITGASAGIGEALAHRFAAGGCDLVLVARSADKLRALATELAKAHGVKAWVEPADLAKPDAAPALAAALARKRRRIDILVNNAGVSEVGRLPRRRPNASGAGRPQRRRRLRCSFPPPMGMQAVALNVASSSSFLPVRDKGYAASKGPAAHRVVRRGAPRPASRSRRCALIHQDER
jgi:hypothetical protein